MSGRSLIAGWNRTSGPVDFGESKSRQFHSLIKQTRPEAGFHR